MLTHLTVGREILSTLQKCKHPVTLKRIAGWHYKKSFGSVYQLIHRLKKAGYILEVNKGKFAITDNGLKELQRQI